MLSPRTPRVAPTPRGAGVLRYWIVGERSGVLAPAVSAVTCRISALSWLIMSTAAPAVRTSRHVGTSCAFGGSFRLGWRSEERRVGKGGSCSGDVGWSGIFKKNKYRIDNKIKEK